MLDWGRVRFFWAEVAQNFTRNFAMAVTAVGTIAISIVILGVFLFLRSSVDQVMKAVVTQVAIAVYLKDGAQGPAVDSLMQSLQADPRVDSVRYVSKRRALMNLRQSLRGQFNFNTLNSNPLPDTIVVHTKSPDDVPVVAAELRARPIVANVNYGSAVTEKLLRAEKVITITGFAVVALLIVATGLIMYNTIRLTVFARQREITIMQLVGATRWTVRWPFVFEGLLSGLIGTAFGLAALAIGYRELAPKFIIHLPFIPFNPATLPLAHLTGELLLVGVLVGMLSSMLSVSRYLKTA
jgi:cell division transport system permease protein